MIKVTAGDPVSLECKVTGSPELKVKWLKDRRELQSIRQHKLSFENNISSLKIQSVQQEDEGEYTFEVANHISGCACKIKVIVLGWFEHFQTTYSVFQFCAPNFVQTVGYLGLLVFFSFFKLICKKSCFLMVKMKVVCNPCVTMFPH